MQVTGTGISFMAVSTSAGVCLAWLCGTGSTLEQRQWYRLWENLATSVTSLLSLSRRCYVWRHSQKLILLGFSCSEYFHAPPVLVIRRVAAQPLRAPYLFFPPTFLKIDISVFCSITFVAVETIVMLPIEMWLHWQPLKKDRSTKTQHALFLFCWRFPNNPVLSFPLLCVSLYCSLNFDWCTNLSSFWTWAIFCHKYIY